MDTFLKTVLHAKIHGMPIVRTDLNYDGSCGIPGTVLKSAGISEHEQVHIYNQNNGTRIITYAIENSISEEYGIHLLGPAARCGQVGDPVIIVAYRQIPVDSFIAPRIWKHS